MRFLAVALFAVLMIAAPHAAEAAKGKHINAPAPAAVAAPAVATPATTEPQHAAEEAHHEDGAGGLPQMDIARFPGQIFWLILTFTITFLLMRFVALPQVQGVVEGREKRIADDIAEAKIKNEAAKTFVAEYETKLKAARENAQTALREASGASSKKVNDALATQAKSLLSKVQDAETRITAQKKEVSATLATEAAGVVADILKSIAGIQPSTADINAALQKSRSA